MLHGSATKNNSIEIVYDCCECYGITWQDFHFRIAVRMLASAAALRVVWFPVTTCVRETRQGQAEKDTNS